MSELTDQEIVDSVQESIYQLNSHLAKARERNIDIKVFVNETLFFGRATPEIYLTFEAKKVQYFITSNYIAYSGGY